MWWPCAFALVFSAFDNQAWQQAEETLKQMTLPEKVQLTHGEIKNYTNGNVYSIIGFVPGIPRLGVPDLRMNDGPQGYRCDSCKGTSTAFPSALTVASTWDSDIAFRWGESIGEEFLAKGAFIQLGPMINLARVPYGGRTFEYLSGEDPTLASVLTEAAIRGTQSKGVISVPKTLANNNQQTHEIDWVSEVDWQTHEELYAPAFRASVDAEAGSIMCAYNKLLITGASAESDFACQHKFNLITQLKKNWNYTGWVMSDWGATHSTIKSALNGLDQEMSLFHSGFWFDDKLLNAVQNGSVPVTLINEKVMRILYQLYKLNIVGRPVKPCHNCNVTTDAHNQVARNIAAQGIVLLKNQGVLPLNAQKEQRLTVIGEPPVVGTGSGGIFPPYVISGRQGIENNCPGCHISTDVQSAKSSDMVILYVGITSGEAHDRSNLSLPQSDLQLIQDVIDSGAGDNTVVVVTASGAVLLPFADKVAAILLCWMPGQEFGNAAADVLFAKVNPSGKLPITLPKEENQPMMTIEQFPGINGTTNYTERLLVGYRWFQKLAVQPSYEFGFGLSYSEFKLSKVSEIDSDYSLTVKVTNEGDYDGATVVQVYVQTPNALTTPSDPNQTLKLFQKVFLKQGDSRDVKFLLLERHFERFDAQKGLWTKVPGNYLALVGTSSSDLPLTFHFTVS